MTYLNIMADIVGVFHGGVIENVATNGLSHAPFLLAALFLLLLLAFATSCITGCRILAITLLFALPYHY